MTGKKDRLRAGPDVAVALAVAVGTGVALGAGVALGVLGAIAASEAYARERHYERQCRSWRRQCYNGSDRACWKFEDNC